MCGAVPISLRWSASYRVCVFACSLEPDGELMDGGDSNAFNLRLNSIGESSSDTSGPPSSVSSSETRNIIRSNRRKRPPVRLQNLEGVVGACKRGRRMGRRNRTRAEREATADDDQRTRNARERKRVSNVNQEFQQLRSALGRDETDRPLTKLKTLETAIQYIRDLTEELNRLRAEIGEVPPYAYAEGPVPGPSSGKLLSASLPRFNAFGSVQYTRNA